MTARAIQATFSDWRTVKSRKTLQLVFEVPLEQQADVLTMLGAPMPDEQRWCAIALMSPAGPSTNKQERAIIVADGNGPQSKPPTQPAGELQRQRYAAMSPAEQAVVRAAILTDDPRFQQWALGPGHWLPGDAAAYIRERCCEGQSRKFIADVPEYHKRFLALEYSFKIAAGEVAEPR